MENVINELQLPAIPESISDDVKDFLRALHFELSNCLVGSRYIGGLLNASDTIVNGLAINVTSVSDDYTTTQSDDVILCDASSDAITVTLMPASNVIGKIYYLKKVDSSGNAVTVDGDESETIDGSTTQSLSSQYDSITIISDGNNWYKF